MVIVWYGTVKCMVWYHTIYIICTIPKTHTVLRYDWYNTIHVTIPYNTHSSATILIVPPRNPLFSPASWVKLAQKRDAMTMRKAFSFLISLSLLQDLGYAFLSVNPVVGQGRAKSMIASSLPSSCAKWKVFGTMRLSGSFADDNFSDDEISKMDDLIKKLSGERDDVERRDKVAQVLGEKLLQPDGHGSSDRFARLFEERLNAVGDDVRTKAAAEAEAAGENGQPSEEMGKQLWALVDMMVQSKIFFKQTRNDGLVQ